MRDLRISQKKSQKTTQTLANTEKSRTFASLSTKKGRLAQLVQSICLTSRGSAVRIRQRPQSRQIFGGFFHIYTLLILDQPINTII